MQPRPVSPAHVYAAAADITNRSSARREIAGRPSGAAATPACNVTVLTDRGLEAAIRALAERAPIPVKLARLPEDRLPDSVEAAIYYLVAEAITNVAKYAQATCASVAVERSNGFATVLVRDDGIGGAEPVRGSGLVGLADRVEALGGRLHIESPPGRGTQLTAEIPCQTRLKP